MLLSVQEPPASFTACALPGEGESGRVDMVMRTVSTACPMTLSATHKALQAALAYQKP